MFCMLFWTKWPVFKFHSKCNTIKQKMGHVVMFIIPTNILPILSISECVNNLIMVYTVYCMWSLSSQENGGGPGSSQSVLSQDFFESATSLDRPDTVCGDVSGYQCFYILQWLLQQTWGHVSREGLVRGEMKIFGLSVVAQLKKPQRWQSSSVSVSLSYHHTRTHLNPWPWLSRAKDVLGGFVDIVALVMVNRIKLWFCLGWKNDRLFAAARKKIISV